MHIWAVGDLHLSFDQKFRLQKPMEAFGAAWLEHPRKIAASWQAQVADEDIVLICGDTSWALKPEEAVYDLAWLKNLPGHKLIIKGNHDFWWGGIEKTKKLLSPILPLYNNALFFENYAFCGARGYRAEQDGFDAKLAAREYQRLKKSLELGEKSGRDIILLLHYPPYDQDGSANIFTDLIKNYPLKAVIYGHLHKNENNIIIPCIDNIPLYLVSADYLDFKLQMIL